MTTGTPSFHPSCPSNSTDIFYACDFGSRFLGCCNGESVSYVCNSGCYNQIPASFEAHYYNDVTKNDCSSGSEWYVCKHTTPPFFGCCKTNACSNNTSCPSGDLTTAILSTDEAAKSPWYPIASAASASDSHRYPVGAVVGGVIGGIACGFLLTVLFGGLFLYRRRIAQQKLREAQRKLRARSNKTGNGGACHTQYRPYRPIQSLTHYLT